MVTSPRQIVGTLRAARRPAPLRGVALAALALAVLLPACAGDPESSSGAVAQSNAIVPVTAAGLALRVAESGQEAVLINVWATFCVPCREEFPDLVRLQRELAGDGFRLLLVSADFDSDLGAVREFLDEQGVDFETYIKQESDMQFINGLHERWTGALPASFLYDGTGRLREFWQGKASYDDLRAEIVSILERDGVGPASTRGGNS